MIKNLTKILSIILLLIVIMIFYLSLVGVKTKKLNDKIIDQISKINKSISLNLRDVKFLLDPYNFTINIITKNPIVMLGNHKLEIEEIKTKISLKALIYKEFSIDDLQISTKSIKLEDLILLARSFKNSKELFLLDRVVKGGFLTADIMLDFDENGNIKKNYQITGFIKKVKLNFLNKVKASNLSLKFSIQKDKLSLVKIKGNITFFAIIN